MLHTWLTDRFDLSVPVVSAPMAGVAGGALAAAVSTAGGLGMVGFGGGRADDLLAECEIARASGRPFGIGLIAWVLDLQPELLEAALSAGPAFVTVSFGGYAPYVEQVRAAGVACGTQVGTVGEARAAQVVGVDVVIARGGEGGGHGRDEAATLPLLQGVLDAVELPVLAAGGIATGRGLAAAVAAGAAGALVGTAFLATTEAAGAEANKAAVLAAAETDTIYTTVLDIGRGVPWPAEYGGRALRNDFATRWHGRTDELVAAGERSEEPAVWAGQAVGLVHRPQRAAEVVAQLGEAERFLREAADRSR